MPEEIESHPIPLQNITDNDPIKSSNTGFPLKDIFQLIYHSSLLGGVILSILYFTLSAEVFPSIDNISQLASYIIAVFGVAFFFVGYIFLTIIAPSAIMIDKDFKANKKHIVWHLLSVNIIIIIMITYAIASKTPFNLLWILSFIITIPITQLFLNAYSKGTCEDLNSFYFKLSLFTYTTLSTLFSVFIIGASVDSNMSILSIFCITLSLQFMFFVPNTLIILHRELFHNFNANIKKILLIISGAIAIILSILTLIFQFSNKPNSIIIAPFSLLKLGHYKAELHFKEDFIKKHPSFIADTNSMSNTFFVLSSIGDEYVIKKTPIFTVIQAQNNEINVKQIQFDKKMYWYKENNDSVIWNVPDLKTLEKDTSILTNIKQEIDNANQNKNYRVYRIKKENIDFPVVGNEIDLQLTRLRDNAGF